MLSKLERFTDLLGDSRNRRDYNNIIKGSAVLEHSKACYEFLSVCHENGLIPNSCNVKICAKPCKSDVIANLRKQNLREASRRELELAIKAQEMVRECAEEKLKANLDIWSHKYSEDLLEPLENRLREKRRSQFLHYQNQFKKKFNFLRQKQQLLEAEATTRK